MLYIDFDGVILDTEILLFEEWEKNPHKHLLPPWAKAQYIENSDWKYIVNNAEIIKDSVYYLKQMDPNTSFILTKVHSVNNEGCAKIEWLRKNNIKQGIILVPYHLKKTDLVSASGNILIDDSLRNLEDWENNNGKPLFFDIDDDDYDSWQQSNVKKYQKVLDLSKIK